jgi:formylglycine-generating enzyme required for sulfatase activity
MAGWWLVAFLAVAACGGSSSGPNNDGGGDDDGAPPGDDGPFGDAPDPQRSPSCKALAENCGANANESCCTTLAVAGGAYHRSFDVAGDGLSGDMTAPATVSSFRLDKYEITVGRFRNFVTFGTSTQAMPPATGAGAHAAIAGSGWDAAFDASLPADKAALLAALKCDTKFQSWTDAPAANENRPINCISWFEAMAFCAWDGGFLPTEAEWNYAAAGGSEQRAFPWSSPAGSTAIDSTRAATQCTGDGLAGCTLADLLAVGTKPAGDGRFGQSDLAGNVQEWVLDFGNLYANPCSDCASLVSNQTRIIRGGNFHFASDEARTGVRGGFPPEQRFPEVGTRCARPL